MQRRSFLQLLAASSAGLALPKILRAAEPTPSQANPLVMGMIGVGNMGLTHVRSLLGENRVRIAAICDVDRTTAEKAQAIVADSYGSGVAKCAITQDFREVLARPDITGVMIAVPDHWHAIPLILAAQAGKHIYAEKPLSLTIPEGRAMLQAVERSGVTCQIGSQQRSSGPFQRAYEIVRNGFLGKITRIQVGLPGGGAGNPPAPMPPEPVPEGLDYERWLGPAPQAPYYRKRLPYQWRFISDYSGGQLTDWIGHHFDCAAWIMGVSKTGPEAIENASATFLTGPLYNTADKYAFDARYANGTVIEVSSTNRNGIRFEGTAGWLHVSREGVEYSSPSLQAVAIPSQGDILVRRRSHWDDFLVAVAAGTTTICPIQEAHRSVTVAHLANLAFRTSRSTLRWDPHAEKILDAPDAERLMARAYRAPWQLPV